MPVQSCVDRFDERGANFSVHISKEVWYALAATALRFGIIRASRHKSNKLTDVALHDVQQGLAIQAPNCEKKAKSQKKDDAVPQRGLSQV